MNKRTFISFVISLFLSFFLYVQGGGSGFCYENANCGPDSPLWPGVCHTGKSQSPVDLRIAKGPSKPLKLTLNDEYKKSQTSYYLQNNGHSIQIQLSPNLTSLATVTGVGMEGKNILAQIHFHWGSEDRNGSEHFLNGYGFTMEMHFVHYNGKYASFDSALKADKDPKSMVVLGVFLEVDEKGHPAKHEGIESIIKKMSPKYQEKPELVLNSSIKLTDFLPSGKEEKLVRYFGSLTTPPCTEIVLWNVFETPLYITHEQVEAFRKIYSHTRENTNLRKTSRPVLPFGERKIEEFTITIE